MKNCIFCKHFDVDIDISHDCPTCGPDMDTLASCAKHQFCRIYISKYELVKDLRRIGDEHGPKCELFEYED